VAETASLSDDNVASREQDDGIGLLCRSLSEQLGAFGYQWLCACAVFPVLQLTLTVYLGERLAAAADRGPPSEEELLAICRLAWFRKGWMPEEVRLRLVGDIAPVHREAVREAISRFVFAAMNASSAGGEATSPDHVAPPPDWPGVLNAWLAVGSEDTGPDPILLTFMQGRPVDTAVQVSDSASDGPLSRLRRLMDAQARRFFLVAVILSAMLWYWSDSIAALVGASAR
jgi:hypothetical protein